MNKRFWTAALATLLVFALLAGCGQSGTVGTQTTQDSSSVKPATTVDAPKEASQNPVTLSIFIDHTWFWVDSFGGRPVDDEITKRTGVKLNVTKASDNNQLPVMIASGDYTDLIYTQRLWDQVANQTVSYDWNTLIQKYAPNMRVSKTEIGNATQSDGKFYTIYNAYSPPEDWKAEPRMIPSPGTATLHVRADIMEKLGNPKLENLDDFAKILQMVKDKFPKMDPLVLGPEGYGQGYFNIMFGIPAGSTRVYEDGDKIKYIVNASQYKESLKYLNSLYRKGFIKPETLIYKIEQYNQKIGSGDAFAFARSVSESSVANTSFAKAGINAKATVVTNVLSDKAVMVNDSIGWSGTFITKKCKTPDRAIQFIQFMRSEEGEKLAVFGIEGVHYKMGADGYPQFLPALSDIKKQNYGDMVRKIGNMAWGFGFSAKTEAIFNYDPSTPEITNSLSNIGKKIVFKPWLQFVVPPAGTEERDIYNKMGIFITQEATKLIAENSESSFENRYNAMIKALNDMGMAKVEDYMTKKYPSVMTNYK